MPEARYLPRLAAHAGLLVSLLLGAGAAGQTVPAAPAATRPSVPPAPVRAPAGEDPPELPKVRWLAFEESVNYVVVDAKGRPWFLMLGDGSERPRYVSPDVVGVELKLPEDFRTLDVDAANRFWIARYDRLVWHDLNTYKEHEKALPGLFPARESDQWPEVHPGQVWLGHSRGRVYCHDHTGVHVFDGKDWSFHAWPKDVLPTGGKLNLDAARFGHAEGPGGLAFLWARGDALGGFWTHDGHVWLRHSSGRNEALSRLTAVVPLRPGFALACTEDRNAFLVDLASGVSTAAPETAVILKCLARLGSSDAKERAEAVAAVKAMAVGAPEKVARAAGYLDDKALRDRALAVIRSVTFPTTTSAPSWPALRRHAWRGAELLARTPAGDAMLAWREGGKLRLGVLRADGRLVDAPPEMPLTFRRPYPQAVRATRDGRIVVYTTGLWAWDPPRAGSFAPVGGDPLGLEGKLLGVDRLGRIFLEVVKGEHMRVMFDPRYKGTAGRDLFAPEKPTAGLIIDCD